MKHLPGFLLIELLMGVFLCMLFIVGIMHLVQHVTALQQNSIARIALIAAFNRVVESGVQVNVSGQGQSCIYVHEQPYSSDKKLPLSTINITYQKGLYECTLQQTVWKYT